MTGTEPHAPRGTAGSGTNWDRGPRAGHGRGSYASTQARLGTAGRETLWGSRAASGPEELLDSERELRVVACTSRHCRPRDHSWDRGLRAGPEELRDSDRACGLFAVTSDRLLSIRICRSRSVMTLRDFDSRALLEKQSYVESFGLSV